MSNPILFERRTRRVFTSVKLDPLYMHPPVRMLTMRFHWRAFLTLFAISAGFWTGVYYFVQWLRRL